VAPFNPNELNTQYVTQAKEVIERYSPGGAMEGDRFFLYVAFAHTHTPMGYADKWNETSKRSPPPARSSNIFGNTLAEVDAAIGAIIGTIDNAGLGEETLIWLTADNGPADLGVVNCWAIGSTGPYTVNLLTRTYSVPHLLTYLLSYLLTYLLTFLTF
jgi:arylsulfatase A-like enzyme